MQLKASPCRCPDQDAESSTATEALAWEQETVLNQILDRVYDAVVNEGVDPDAIRRAVHLRAKEASRAALNTNEDA